MDRGYNQATHLNDGQGFARARTRHQVELFKNHVAKFDRGDEDEVPVPVQDDDDPVMMFLVQYNTGGQEQPILSQTWARPLRLSKAL